MKPISFILLFWGLINLEGEQSKMPLNFCGERLTFKMEYLNLSVAKLNFEVEDGPASHYHLRVHAKSIGSASFMFRLDNVYETYFDRQTYLPGKIVKHIHQKNIHHELSFTFDHLRRIAQLGESISWDIPADCFDYFSMLYFLRTQPLSLGDELSFHLDSEYIISNVKVKVMSNNQPLKVPAGKFRAIVLNLKFTRVSQPSRPWRTDLLTNRLAAPGSEVSIWISDDQDRLPLKIVYHQSSINTHIVLESFSRGRRQ